MLSIASTYAWSITTLPGETTKLYDVVYLESTHSIPVFSSRPIGKNSEYITFTLSGAGNVNMTLQLLGADGEVIATSDAGDGYIVKLGAAPWSSMTTYAGVGSLMTYDYSGPSTTFEFRFYKLNLATEFKKALIYLSDV